jgi:cytochrome P450
MNATQAPSSDVDPFDERFLANPWPEHERLRELGPVVYLERYGIWGMARFDEVTSTLQDWETFSSAAGAGMANFRRETPWRKPSIILEADPPLHTRTHKVLLRVLSPAALRDLKPLFDREAERLVDTLAAAGTFDGVSDLATVFPLRVFPDAMGLHEAGREKLLIYGDMVFNAFGPRNERLERSLAAAGEVLPAITELCERSALREDGIGARIYDAVDTGEIAADEAPLLVRSLLSAGLDTTINSIAAALLCLARNPDQYQRLREDPSVVRTAFDEAIRLESPVQSFFRTTNSATEVAGTPIPYDAKVMLFLASANHDPRHWTDPTRYDLARRTGGHVGFGTGIHRCVGEMLSRLEGESILTALAGRASSLHLTADPKLRINNTIRGYEKIPLAIT